MFVLLLPSSRLIALSTLFLFLSLYPPKPRSTALRVSITRLSAFYALSTNSSAVSSTSIQHTTLNPDLPGSRPSPAFPRSAIISAPDCPGHPSLPPALPPSRAALHPSNASELGSGTGTGDGGPHPYARASLPLETRPVVRHNSSFSSRRLRTGRHGQPRITNTHLSKNMLE